MNICYSPWRRLWGYLGGAAAARAGDEMSGPALLLFGFAVTGRPGTGSELLASVTIAAAAGGPAFGVLLDRSRRPGRVLAAALACCALGLIAVQAAVGQLPVPAVAAIALTAGLFNPAVAGGWTAQLPRIVTGHELSRGSALDAMTYSAASLVGPARGALLISAIAAASLAANAILARRPARGRPDIRIFASTLVIGVSMAAAAVAPGWLTVLAVAAGGAGEGPQLTALFAVRHRDAPEHMRGQIYATAASLKIAGMAAGAALAGPLAARSVTTCLLIAAGTEVCAAAAYLLTGVAAAGRKAPAATFRPALSAGPAGGTTARLEK